MNCTHFRPGERLDDLQHNGLVIIQNRNQFCFGTDSILLAHFASDDKAKKVCDLGTGSGVLPLLLSDMMPQASFVGVEIQADVCDMARRSVEINSLEKRIEIREMNLVDAPAVFGKASFDMVICNPPYGKRGSCVLCNNDAKNIARHEILCTLEDIIRTATGLLCNGGRFYLVHQTERMLEILELLRENCLEPKKLQMVHPQVSKAPYLILLEAVKGQKSNMQILPPLIVYDDAGNYTPDLREIYGISET